MSCGRLMRAWHVGASRGRGHVGGPWNAHGRERRRCVRPGRRVCAPSESRVPCRAPTGMRPDARI
eukprot:6580278-Prymnesium_polylepis.1